MFNKKKTAKVATNGVRAVATSVKKSIIVFRTVSIVAIATVALVGTTYVLSVFHENMSSFTVNVGKADQLNQGLTLSELPEFEKPVGRLNANTMKDATNISQDQIPDNVDMISGEHNGDHYIAYTFYMKNMGTDTVNYQYQLLISNITKNVDEAIRLKLYVNGQPTVYAKTKSDGTGPESGTQEFLTRSIACLKIVNDFKPEEVHKFTVVIWIEGDDPDCLDDIIGGKIKTEMQFDIIENS